VNRISTEVTSPTCAGTGLVALDIVLNRDSDTLPRVWAGGSCGNVLAILAYLGWRAVPVARLGQDQAASQIINDWQQFGVNCEFVERDPRVSTPIIVEHIRLVPNGNPTHRYLWICPSCGAWLPRYRPILLTCARQVLQQLPPLSCFYFDRISPAAFEMAVRASQSGALVVFEPASVKDNEAFKRAANISHILKYASDRVIEQVCLSSSDGPAIVIETLGPRGIRYKLRDQQSLGEWHYLAAFDVKGFRDAAGAGDWCTAGIIHMLGTIGSAGLKTASEKIIKKAIEVGQAMAALNCCFQGPRGGMYVLEPDDFQKMIRRIRDNRVVDEPSLRVLPETGIESLLPPCPACNGRRQK